VRRRCDICGRSAWIDRKNCEVKALAICYSNLQKAWCCLRCHFNGRAPPRYVGLRAGRSEMQHQRRAANTALGSDNERRV